MGWGTFAPSHAPFKSPTVSETDRNSCPSQSGGNGGGGFKANSARHRTLCCHSKTMTLLLAIFEICLIGFCAVRLVGVARRECGRGRSYSARLERYEAMLVRRRAATTHVAKPASAGVAGSLGGLLDGWMGDFGADDVWHEDDGGTNRTDDDGNGTMIETTESPPAITAAKLVSPSSTAGIRHNSWHRYRTRHRFHRERVRHRRRRYKLAMVRRRPARFFFVKALWLALAFGLVILLLFGLRKGYWSLLLPHICLQAMTTGVVLLHFSAHVFIWRHYRYSPNAALLAVKVYLLTVVVRCCRYLKERKEALNGRPHTSPSAPELQEQQQQQQQQQEQEAPPLPDKSTLYPGV